MEDYEMIFDSSGMKAYLRWSDLDRMLGAVSSISNEQGYVMAYTDGCSIANRNHELMPNGDSLNYNQGFYDYWFNCDRGYAGRQNIIILPDPGNEDNSYIVHDLIEIDLDLMAGTIDFPHRRLSYSYIDMNKENGLGDVSAKNIQILGSRTTASHLTAINHVNKKDWWIIKPAYEGEKYYSILLDENGFSKIDSQYIGPQFITETIIINPVNVGASRFSPDGTKYAYFSLVDGLHVYDFDRATGLLSNLRLLPWTPINSQNVLGGLEFSPNSRYIYICNRESIFQVDLQESNLADGLFRVTEHDDEVIGGLFDFMALGPDCRIYIRQYGAFQYHFSSINAPDKKGNDCEFKQGNVIIPTPPNGGNFPHFPRYRVDEDKPCCPTVRTPIETAPSLEEVFCGDWYNIIRNYGERRCDNPAFFTEMKLYRKGNIELLHFTRFLSDVGRGGFYDLNGYTVGRSETRDGVFSVWPDSIQEYEFIRILGDCNTGFPSCGPVSYDCPDLMADIGDVCNDNDPATQNDVILTDCTCVGEFIFDCPALMLNIGDPCDDGEATTLQDVITSTCVCSGESIFDCEVSMVNFGDPCDDGDPNTVNDMIDTNCQCVGERLYDCPSIMLNIGAVCDDGLLYTENDTINENCICTGEVVYPEIPCPDPFDDILCFDWLQDSLINAECLFSPCSFIIGGLSIEEGSPISHVIIFVDHRLAGGVGTIHTCDGTEVGTIHTTSQSPTTWDPDTFATYHSFVHTNFEWDYQPCPTADRDGDGYIALEDCNDNDPNIYPAAEEFCNDLDDDCDGLIDEGLTVTRYYYDGDGDGYGVPDPSLVSCDQPSGYVLSFDDCNDMDSLVHPGQAETPYNGKDDDCNTTTPDDDLDGDGYLLIEDCNDMDASIHPAAEELCDEMDNNCNGEIDEGLELMVSYADLDGDGYGSALDSMVYCDVVTGYVDNDLDCEDSNPAINPSLSEIAYNGIDDDCNPTTLDDDLDQDGFPITDDCDDNNSNINPDADDIPNNGIDEDCDGMDLISSIHELANTIINIYPNPAADIIYIDVSGHLDYHTTLYDLDGKLIITAYNNTQLRIEELPSGSYLLEVKDRESDQKIIERIIIGR